MKIAELKYTVDIPELVSLSIEGNIITAKGPHGEAKRSWNDPTVSIKTEAKHVILFAKNASKKQKRTMATMQAQIANIVRGVKNNNEYKLKICASHFPMQVALEGNTIVVKNFFGEKVPRKIELPKEVQVKVQGDKITLTCADIEQVGQAASRIEQLCRITNRDRRVFQDGIYLIEKNGKVL